MVEKGKENWGLGNNDIGGNMFTWQPVHEATWTAHACNS